MRLNIGNYRKTFFCSRNEKLNYVTDHRARNRDPKKHD